MNVLDNTLIPWINPFKAASYSLKCRELTRDNVSLTALSLFVGQPAVIAVFVTLHYCIISILD